MAFSHILFLHTKNRLYMINEKKSGLLHGVLFIALFSFAAFYVAEFDFVKKLSFSPLIVGIILGMIYANTLRESLPASWNPGLAFCTKRILRLGIILYGFRLTFQQVIDIGISAIAIDAVVVTFTILLGIFVGRLLHMDRSTALLTSTGSAICGAAAVLGAEPVVKAEPHKTAVAVSTVVVFGTLAMFLYPAAYRMGFIHMTPQEMGLYTGATLHEVAHVAGAGNAMGTAISDPAIIVKMIRVILLAPALLVMSICLAKFSKGGKKQGGKITIPWFAFGFMLVIGFNSLNLLPASVVSAINTFDTFLLTMAMTALGAETSIDKFRRAGGKPFLLAFILWMWLIFGGYALVKLIA